MRKHSYRIKTADFFGRDALQIMEALYRVLLIGGERDEDGVRTFV